MLPFTAGVFTIQLASIYHNSFWLLVQATDAPMQRNTSSPATALSAFDVSVRATVCLCGVFFLFYSQAPKFAFRLSVALNLYQSTA